MITIIDYGVGNLGSIANMLRKIGVDSCVSSDPSAIGLATKLILPGVGAFDHGITMLRQRELVEPLSERVLGAKVPLLGLCLGAQLLGRSSEEGSCPGLGWIEAHSVRFRFLESHSRLKVPHMGWNSIRVERNTPLLEDLPPGARFYFVHSYHLVCGDPSEVLATTEYGHRFASGIGRGHIMGLQFHPEKSHRFGMGVLKNFAERVQ